MASAGGDGRQRISRPKRARVVELRQLNLVEKRLIGDVLAHYPRDLVASNAHKAAVRIDIVERGAARIVEAPQNELANRRGGFKPARFLACASHLARIGRECDAAAIDSGGEIRRKVRKAVIRRADTRISVRTLSRFA